MRRHRCRGLRWLLQVFPCRTCAVHDLVECKAKWQAAANRTALFDRHIDDHRRHLALHQAALRQGCEDKRNSARVLADYMESRQQPKAAAHWRQLAAQREQGFMGQGLVESMLGQQRGYYARQQARPGLIAQALGSPLGGLGL